MITNSGGLGNGFRHEVEDIRREGISEHSYRVQAISRTAATWGEWRAGIVKIT